MGVSAKQMAAYLGVSVSALSERARRGTVPRNRDGTYDPPQVIAAWYLNADPARRLGGRLGGAARAAQRGARL